MRRVCSASLAMDLGLAGSAAGQQPRIDRVVIVDSGLLEARKIDAVSTPGAASGETSALDSVVFYEASRPVPASEGIQFAARYRIIGSPTGQAAAVDAGVPGRRLQAQFRDLRCR